MALFWTDAHDVGVVREVAAAGEWRNGVRVPSGADAPRARPGALIHDIVRTLLDLGAPSARLVEPEPGPRGAPRDSTASTADASGSRR